MIEEATNENEEIHKTREMIEDEEAKIKRLESINAEYQTTLNDMVKNAGGNNPHVKINVREQLLKDDKDYISITKQMARNLNDIAECKEIKANLIEDEKEICKELDDSCTLIEEVVSSIMEGNIESIMEDIEEVVNETSLVVIDKVPSEYNDENLQEAIEFVTDTFYDYKDENFYTKNNKYKAVSDTDKLMLFKEYVLYCIGTRHVKATGATKPISYSFDNIDKTKGKILIEAYVKFLGTEEDRAVGLKNLTNIEVLSTKEKLNYIQNGF